MIKVTPQIQSYQGYKISDLDKAFKKVQDKEHWKNPISAVIKREDMAILRVAIPFYTGTPAFFYHYAGLTIVKADGYYQGPCN